jgi:hypothetical protein
VFVTTIFFVKYSLSYLLQEKPEDTQVVKETKLHEQLQDTIKK